MGWADCGTDSKGRPIGYAHRARCDHPGCKKRIDRGLAYACGGMHGQNEHDCEGYFCDEHTKSRAVDDDHFRLCHGCAAQFDEWMAEELFYALKHALKALPMEATDSREAIYDALGKFDELIGCPIDERFLTPKQVEQMRSYEAHSASHEADAR